MFNRRLVANALLKTAKSVLAYENDEEEAAKAEELGKKIDELVKPALDALKERQAKLDEITKKAKEIEKELKEAFKEFDALTGYSKAVDALMEEVKAFETAGGNLSKIASACKVARKKSVQPSYKEWMMVVISTLNEAEIKKYFFDRVGDFKKNTLSLSTGIGVLDVCQKEWAPEAKELADERNVKLPKASRRLTAHGMVVKAGWTDWFKSIGMNIANFIKDIFRPVIDWAKGLLGKAKSNADKVNDFNKKIEKLAAKAGNF